MRKIYCQAFMLGIAGLLALWLVPALAVEVEHHGVTADTEGTAAYCLTCHDGSAGKKIVVCSTPCLNPNTHKMLIPYPPPGKRGYATLEAVLAAGLNLEEGMITCITCHDLTNPLRHHFAVDATPYAQKLCYLCHLEIDDLGESSRHFPQRKQGASESKNSIWVQSPPAIRHRHPGRI
jgi:hypothetical protein